MHLKIYKTEEQKDKDENVISSKTTGEVARTITNIKTLTFEFDRGIFTVVHRPGGGPLVTESGELHTLYKNGKASNSFFESHSDVTQKAGKAPVESAVGHLVDPTTVPTHPITSGATKDMTVPENKPGQQATPTPDVVGAKTTPAKEPDKKK